jgi:hypothetical protein
MIGFIDWFSVPVERAQYVKLTVDANAVRDAPRERIASPKPASAIAALAAVR